MTGPRQDAQPARFYELSLKDHLLRSLDRFVGLSSLCAHLADFYSHTGRSPVDPDLLIRMLVVGDCVGIRSERRMCEEVHPNLAYRWLCRRDLGDRVPGHSTFPKTGMGAFATATCCATCLTRLSRAPSSKRLGLEGLRRRGSCGANDRFLFAAKAQNLRKLARIFPAAHQTRKAR